jgi:endonuclease/exonuclease/phosphatase family metal-dependent hydrolase
MRIATWNLDHASNSSRPIDAQIAQITKLVKADILVLTETCDQVDLHAYGYKCVSPHRKNKYGKYWSTIWSKLPITHQIDCYDNETAVCAQITTPSGDLIIYGTIITWQNDPGSDPSKKSPPWAEHEKSIIDHGADWRAIQDKDQYRGIPFIVMGDFNQTRDGASRGYRSPNGIQLLNSQLDRNQLQCITEEDFGAQGKLTPDPENKGLYRHNVDHICVTRSRFTVDHVGAWDHFSEKTYWSDHNGVYAELSLP